MTRIPSIHTYVRTGAEEYVLSATNVCFESLRYTEDQRFSAPLDGEIIGVRVEYKSGGVTCNNRTRDYQLTHFGCWNVDWIFIEMISTEGVTWYPTSTTDGVTRLKPLDCEIGEIKWGCSVQYYWMDGYDGRDSPYIEWRDDIKSVTTLNTFSIQVLSPPSVVC